MEKHHILVNSRNILLTILVLMLFLNAFPINIIKGQEVAQVSVEPSNQSVGQPSLPLPTPPFSINITVGSVHDLSAWEILLYYNLTVLTYDSTALPSGHVFDGKQFFQAPLVTGSDSKGNYLLLGAVLLSGTTFSGSGTLCQIKFIGYTGGTSSLKLDIVADQGFHTNLLNSTQNEIHPINIANGQVTVLGSQTPKQPSSITINVDQSSVPLGSNVTVSGDINVTRAGLTVTIYYRASGGATWSELTRASTDANGHYFYPWNTTQNYGITLHELKASWLGDVDYGGAESNTVTVSVNKRTSTISLSAQPGNVTAGSGVTISVAVAPKPVRPPEITISYRLAGGNWAILQTLTTDIDGARTFTWTTSTRGSYELKASWSGDEDYAGAESSISTVEVTGEAPPPDQPGIMDYLPYIVAAVAIVAAIGVAIYFLKFKKR